MSAAGLVCGFWDEATGLAGLGWKLGNAEGGLLMREGRATPAAASISAEDEALRLELASEAGDARAELIPDPAVAKLDLERAAEAESAPCAATVQVDGRSLRCRGHLTRWREDPLAGAGILRHLALPAAGGSLLIVLARADAGSGSHAEESGAAWLLGGEGGPGSYPHAYLSTQYDEDGHQTRAGLELWSAEADAPPIRAAGTTIGTGVAGGVEAAILSTSTEGTEGMGSYLIWRG